MRHESRAADGRANDVKRGGDPLAGACAWTQQQTKHETLTWIAPEPVPQPPLPNLAPPPPKVLAELRRPVHETFEWLRDRLAGVLADGQARGEFAAGFEPAEVAATIAAVIQGGYVLARAGGSAEPFYLAVKGVESLLRME